VTHRAYGSTQLGQPFFYASTGRIKYTDLKHANHFLDTLRKYYKKKFLSIGRSTDMRLTLAMEYVDGMSAISMPSYIRRALIRFQHRHPSKPQHAPHEWTRPHMAT
jgi:hypothetical protein